ncbi:MAG: DNA polymerase domain-containing protein [Firmicutes bacterium HGW-Firmicutes-13]|nr:MAG: DNA polymerase domain-containing protein [Firmicutes bacterium HGW-Firmicutes-13]
MADNFLKVDGREIRLTNLDKILWTEDGYTKYHLIKYYLDTAPFLIKYLKNRPVVFQRFPEGINKKGFYQKNCPEEAPSWIKTYPVPSRHEDRFTNYILVEDVPTLVWLGNQACIEIHPWFSSLDNLEFPDFACFDLDPMEKSTFSQVRQVASAIREVLSDTGIKCYPKTSGATGLQIYVPLESRYTYEEVRIFVEYFCRVVHKLHPQITTLERKVEKRKGRIYLDYLQNAWGKTLNAPYSVRPVKGAPVSVPLLWSEVEEGKISSSSFFNIDSVKPRLEEKGDIFEEVLQKKQNIDKILIKY